jgi:rfaE bifunctional protein kinase chain/domain
MSQTVEAKKLKSVFAKLNKLKVFVIGDAMMDHYWLGSIDRISPEAPVPILLVNQKDGRPGGAANVALNCKALGADVSLLTVVGDDKSGRELSQLLFQQGICTDYIIRSKERITTTKTRVISKNQQVIRLDEELTDELSIKDEHHFIDTCLKAIQIEVPDIVIFEDYNKGVLKENVIQKIITHCKHVGVLTAVDPKKKNFLAYQQVDIFKPNLKEIKEALNLGSLKVNLMSLKGLHAQLIKKLNHQLTLITLSEHGIFAQKEKEAVLYPAHIREIADVSGAGDTVIAVAAMIYSITKDIHLSAQISNLAGGLVCEEVGVVPIDSQTLLEHSLELVSGV